MALITKVETLRKYVKVSYNTTTAGTLPDMDLPEMLYIQPLLGTDLLAGLYENIANPAYEKLLSLCRAVIAPMAVYHDLPFIQGLISESGIKIMNSDTMQSAPKWVYKQLREALLNKAGMATEALTEYLFANKTTLSWTNEAAENCIFKTGKDFGTYYDIQQPYRTFISLLPIIKMIEDHYISTTIGGDFYQSFIAAPLNTQHTKKLSDLLKKSIANLTISKAAERLPVKISANGFTVRMANNEDRDDPYNAEKTPTDRQIELVRLSAEDNGLRYLKQLKSFLDFKPVEPAFALYYASEYYIEPINIIDETDANSDRLGVFAF